MKSPESPASDALPAPRRGSGRPAGRPPRSREEILGAAAQVFGRNGYGAARMDDIAEELGIAKGSLYHYIDSKHELLFEIIPPPYRDFVSHLDQVLISPAPVPERIAEVVHHHLDNVARYAPAISIYVENVRSLTLPAELFELDARYLHGLRRLISIGMADGSLRFEDPDVAADVLLGMCNWFAIRHPARAFSEPKVLAQAVSSIFLEGMMARSARRRSLVRRGRRA